MIGRTLGHFRVLDKLGDGAMGEVFLAEDTTLRRRVALKLLSASTDDQPRLVEELRREAIALAAVNHPNVVTVHAVAEQDGAAFVVMELLEGRTLQQAIPPDGLALADLLDYSTGIAAAIDAAHSSGVLHRDLKPGNVMITDDGRVKVVDFGLAIAADVALRSAHPAEAAALTPIAGTLAYMAPEQLAGEGVDRSSDLYSFGVVLYEMATGRLPFSAASAPSLMRQILVEPPPLLSSLRPELPQRLTRLVSALLSKEPRGRPGSARIVIDELARCRRGEGIAPTRSGARLAAPSASTAGPADLEVARLLVRGRHLLTRRTEPALRAALGCFQEVIDLDPFQAKAWIGIADTLNLLSNYGFAPPGDSVVRVRAAVARAVELEGESDGSLRTLALAAWQFEFDWAQAEELYRRALDADPASALTHHWYGVLLGVTERFDESLASFAQAEALDPLSLISLATRGWFTLFAGRPEEAHAILRRVMSLDSAYFPAYWYDGQTLAVLGRHDEAVESLRRAAELGGRSSRTLGYLGHTLGLAGRAGEARDILAELSERARESYVPTYFQAMITSGLGELSETLRLLGRALDDGDTMIRDLAIDTPWWSLRDQPKYQILLRRMGLRAAG